MNEYIYQVQVLGNFWGGKYYEWGIDSIFVLAYNEENAATIAKMNIQAVENHFRNKKLHCGKLDIAKNDPHKFTEKDICKVSLSKQTQYNKTLTSRGIFEPVTL